MESMDGCKEGIQGIASKLISETERNHENNYIPYGGGDLVWGRGK